MNSSLKNISAVASSFENFLEKNNISVVLNWPYDGFQIDRLSRITCAGCSAQDVGNSSESNPVSQGVQISEPDAICE